MERVKVYVDGFNLYFGLRAKYGRRFHWLDLQKLAESLLKPQQELVQVDYFTARVRNDPPAERRQSDYIDALTNYCPKLTVIDGRYQQKERRCRECATTWIVYEEKETDVNIAVTLVEDAALDRFDSAIIISADSDLSPALRSLKRIAPHKRTVVALPPHRRSYDLQRHADAYYSLGTTKIRQAQLPDTITTTTGITLERPTHWQLP